MKNIQKNILVTGSNGQLASELKLYKKKNNFRFVFADKKKLDITKISHLINFFKFTNVDIIINCASYNKVDQAEEEKITAYKVNKEGVKNLIDILAKQLKISRNKIKFQNNKNAGHYDIKPTPFKPRIGKNIKINKEKDFKNSLMDLIS